MAHRLHKVQWPPLSSSDYEFLKLFKFRPERAWDDHTAVSDPAVERVMLLGDIHNKRLWVPENAAVCADHPVADQAVCWFSRSFRWGAAKRGSRVVLSDGPGWRQQVCDSCRRRSPAVSP